MKKLFTLLVLSATTLASFASTGSGKQCVNLKAAPGMSVQGFTAKVADNTADLSALPLITEAEGSVTEYSRNSIFYAINDYGELGFAIDYGRVAEVVTGDDGRIYFKNPFGGIDTDSYLVGTVDGEKISVTLPQKIQVEEYDDWENEGQVIRDNYYAVKLLYTNNGETSEMKVDNTDQTITFTYNEDGIYQSDDNNVFIGRLKEVTNEQGQKGLVWTGFADAALDFKPVTDTPVVAPDNVEFEQWVISCDDDLQFAEVAISGEDIYIRNFMPKFPEATVKGTISGGKAVFDSEQFLGIDRYWEHFAYFTGATYDPAAGDDEDEIIYEPADRFEFTYDAAARKLTSGEGNAMVISTIKRRIFMLAAFNSPSLWFQSSAPMELLTPEIDSYEDLGDEGYITYEISPVAADGRLLDPANYFYNIYLDNEKMTLYPDEFDIEDEMVNIPYDFEDFMGGIYFYGDYHEAMITSTGFKKIGIGAIYINADGTESHSDIGWYYVDPTSIDNPETAAKEVKNVEYFDLSGRRLAKPAAGVSIRRTTFSDGTVVTEKRLCR